MTELVTVTDKATGFQRQYTLEAFNAERDKLLLAWQLSKDALEKAKEEEMKLRKQCVDFMFDPDKVKGTERVELGGGYEAKAVKKLNYGFVKKPDGKGVDRKLVNVALDQIEKLGPVQAHIAEELVKWSPELSLTTYNKLADTYPQIKTIIDQVIVTSEGAPTLEIIEPKVKK